MEAVGSDGKSERSIQFLLEEYRQHVQAIGDSERTGETRVGFFFTITAAVFAALLFEERGLFSQSFWPRAEVCAVLLAMLAFGQLTLARVVHRNLVTDREIESARKIRAYFLAAEPWLAGYFSRSVEPLKVRARLEFRMLVGRGGLAETVVLWNGLIVSALFGLLGAALPHHVGTGAGPAPGWAVQALAILFGVLGLMLSSWPQQWWVNKRYTQDQTERAKLMASSHPGTDVITTTELRWFWPGKLEASLETWFRASKSLLGDPLGDADLDRRTDCYLIDAESTAFSLKLREKRLELKRLLSARDYSAGRAGVEGIAQLWRKSDWSYDPGENSGSDPVIAAFTAGEDAPNIAVVGKRRWQRKYVPTDDGSIERVPFVPLRVACNVELTALELGGAAWWTICFEAYGDIERPGTLTAVVDWFFDRFPGPKPKRDQSESYPSWMAASALGR